MSTPPVHLEGHGFLTAEGRYYPEATVKAALLSICEWWAALSDAERAGLLHAAHLAEIDREIDAAVLGGAQ